ncbi:MAG: cytochrome b [Pseudomonadota bacterium]
MNLSNSQIEWGAVAKLLHWTIALLIVGLAAAGLFMVRLDASPQKFEIYALHKATGIVVLGLMALRLVWRFVNPTPALPTDMTGLERFLAHATHWALYAIALALPLSGWIMSSAADFPVSMYGWVTLPDLVGPDEDLTELAGTVHEILSKILIGLFVLHVLAALKHHYVETDTTLLRMLPGRLGASQTK